MNGGKNGIFVFILLLCLCRVQATNSKGTKFYHSSELCSKSFTTYPQMDAMVCSIFCRRQNCLGYMTELEGSIKICNLYDEVPTVPPESNQLCWSLECTEKIENYGNAKTTWKATGYDLVGSNTTITCDSGNRTASGKIEQVVNCGSEGWSEYEICESACLGSLGSIGNAETTWDSGKTYLVDDTVKTTCDSGSRTRSGFSEQTVKCLSSGLWSEFEVCKTACLGILGSIGNAATTWSNGELYLVTDTIRITCGSSSKTKSGLSVQTVQCLSTGLWSTFQICETVCLESLASISKGSSNYVNGVNYFVESKVKISCRTGYIYKTGGKFKGSTHEVKCQSNGVWSDPGSCKLFGIGK